MDGGCDPRSMVDSVTVLERLLARVRYKDGWSFGLGAWSLCADSPAVSLRITVDVSDSVSGAPMQVCHHVPIPGYLSSEQEARRWLLERIFDVERHEAMEFFTVDGAAPFFPDHESGHPYAVIEREVPVRVTRPAHAGSTLGSLPWR